MRRSLQAVQSLVEEINQIEYPRLITIALPHQEGELETNILVGKGTAWEKVWMNMIDSMKALRDKGRVVLQDSARFGKESRPRRNEFVFDKDGVRMRFGFFHCQYMTEAARIGSLDEVALRRFWRVEPVVPENFFEDDEWFLGQAQAGRLCTAEQAEATMAYLESIFFGVH